MAPTVQCCLQTEAVYVLAEKLVYRRSDEVCQRTNGNV